MDLKNFNKNEHNSQIVANMIYDADIEMNSLVLGTREEAIEIINKMMSMDKTYYTSKYLNVTMVDQEIVGVLVGYPVVEKKEVDTYTGKALMNIYGLKKFFKKMMVFIKMGKITSGKMVQDGYYVVQLCVRKDMRGQGVGKRIIDALKQKYENIYLHVNIKNKDAIKFYEAVGFQRGHEASIRINNNEYGTIFMMLNKD